MTTHTHNHPKHHNPVPDPLYTPPRPSFIPPQLDPADPESYRREASPPWSVTLEFPAQPGMDRATFLQFDQFMRNEAARYLGVSVGGTNAGP